MKKRILLLLFIGFFLYLPLDAVIRSYIEPTIPDFSGYKKVCSLYGLENNDIEVTVTEWHFSGFRRDVIRSKMFSFFSPSLFHKTVNELSDIETILCISSTFEMSKSKKPMIPVYIWSGNEGEYNYRWSIDGIEVEVRSGVDLVEEESQIQNSIYIKYEKNRIHYFLNTGFLAEQDGYTFSIDGMEEFLYEKVSLLLSD